MGGSERMIIEVEIYEKIRFFHEQEGKSQRQIALILGISRTTVKKYLEGSAVPWQRAGTSGRTSYVITEEVEKFIKACIAEDESENIKKQRHTSRRIYDRLVEEHGFLGGESTLRPIVAELKKKLPKSFVPLSYDPAEAIQIDWGEATIYLNCKKTKLNLFCMRQCYSADIFVKAFYRQNEESFLEGLSDGLDYFGGTPTKIIFDNARVAVKEGFGVFAKVQDNYKAFAAHHAFKTEFCNIASGHEKGLVEGLVGFIRRNVLVPVPRVQTLDLLNEALHAKCLKYRNHLIKGRKLTVGQMVDVEKPRFIPLPEYRFDTSRSLTSLVDEFSVVRFDTNKYSVPFSFVGKSVTVKGYGNWVKIYYRNTEIAVYPRSYERNDVNYKIEHYIDLIEKRPRSVFNAKPVKQNLNPELMDLGKRLLEPKEMVKLLRLCIDYGQEKVLKASKELVPGKPFKTALLMAYIAPNDKIKPLSLANEIKVKNTGLSKYDELLRGEMAL